MIKTRSSWHNRALRDDEAVYWVSKRHYEAVAVGNWGYWVSRGHLCLYILHKVEIWTGVTEAWRTDGQTLKDSATQLLTKYKSGALVTQNSEPLFFQIQEGTSAERILLCVRVMRLKERLLLREKDCSCRILMWFGKSIQNHNNNLFFFQWVEQCLHYKSEV